MLIILPQRSTEFGESDPNKSIWTRQHDGDAGAAAGEKETLC